jgi:hypothetical protein
MGGSHDGNPGNPPDKSTEKTAESPAPKVEHGLGQTAVAAKDLASMEAMRTNASDGSLRDKIAMATHQDDSIEISYPGGRASRHNKVTEKEIERVGPKTFSMGLTFHDAEHTPTEKLTAFIGAAAGRASNPEAYKTYVQEEITKLLGVAEGLNLAKEETKTAAGHAWKALTDGTVAAYLTHPQATGHVLFSPLAQALHALPKNPEEAHRALTGLGLAMLATSEQYGRLNPREKGKIIGKIAFGMINPEGSTEAGEAAFKLASRGVAGAHETVQQLALHSPAAAHQAKQALFDYTQRLGMSPAQIGEAGIPADFFHNMVSDVKFAGGQALGFVKERMGKEAERAAEVAERLHVSPEVLAARRQVAEHDAVRLVQKASLVEPRVTDYLTDIASERGGHLVGLEHKLKSVDSLTRKIADGASPDRIKDALRYTMVFDEREFAGRVNEVVGQLEDDGLPALKVKNTFQRNVPYKGVNCCFEHEGQYFELQFHTPGSIALKNQNHGLYELAREIVNWDDKTAAFYAKPLEQSIPKVVAQKNKLADYPRLSDLAERFITPKDRFDNLAGVRPLKDKELYNGLDAQLRRNCNAHRNPFQISSIKNVDRFAEK